MTALDREGRPSREQTPFPNPFPTEVVPPRSPVESVREPSNLTVETPMAPRRHLEVPVTRSAHTVDLTGRVAVVAGLPFPFAVEVARKLGEAGAEVLLFRDPSAPEPPPAETAGTPGRIRSFPVRLSEREDIQRYVDEVVSEYHAVDILVDVLGGVRDAPLLDLTEQNWDSHVSCCLREAFLLSQLLGREMAGQGRGGRIVNIVLPPPIVAQSAHDPVSTVVEGGILGLTRSFAYELAPYDVTVNAVLPGVLEKGAMRWSAPRREAPAERVHRIPKGRLARPDDVTSLMLFLLSDEADYCTGAAFVVDGGLRVT